MAITLVTLRPTYDVYSTWYRKPDSAEPNTNWSIISKPETDDEVEHLYKWLPASPWFDEEQIYLCDSYIIPVGLIDPSVLISVRAKSERTNIRLPAGIATLRVCYYYYEDPITHYIVEEYTDFTLTSDWTTHQIEIPFDWSDPQKLIKNIRFKARLDA